MRSRRRVRDLSMRAQGRRSAQDGVAVAGAVEDGEDLGSVAREAVVDAVFFLRGGFEPLSRRGCCRRECA